ncbi:MAG: ATP-binding protein [Smithellaceae bacterium]
MLYQGCSFETFSGNKKLVNDLRQISVDRKNVILRGNTGSGKTHLSVSMIRGVQEAKFVTVPDLLLKIRSSFNGGAESEEEIIRRFSEIEVLVLDDLGAEKTSEYSITTLYLILDRRIRDCRQTIITTNLNQLEIEETFGARIASRLSGMENIKINMPDYRKKRGEK